MINTLPSHLKRMIAFLFLLFYYWAAQSHCSLTWSRWLLICCSLSVLSWMRHLLSWLHLCEWSFIFHPDGQLRVTLENPKYLLELTLYAWLLSHHIGTHGWKNSQVMGWRIKFQSLKGATIELHWQDCGRKEWRITTTYWFYLGTGWKWR